MADTPFSRLVRRLRKAGLTVVIYPPEYDMARWAYVKGNRNFPIQGGFADTDEHGAYLQGHIVADHAKCFDKYNKCPLRMRLPETEEQAKRITAELRKLGTPEGFRISNSFAYLDHNPFPYERGGLD